MKLAELCNTSPSYIGEIEIGRKFPSVEMVEKIASVLKIEPHHLFKDRVEMSDDYKTYPLLPNSMKDEMKNQIYSSINEIFNKY